MIAHVQIVDFFITVERLARPDLEGCALLIGSAAPDGRVAAASSEARALGVRAGMRMADACTLAPNAVSLPGRIERYLEISAQVDERLRQAASAIEWIAADEAWLALDDRRTRGSLDAVRDSLARDLSLDIAIGAASTKAAAAVASRLVLPSGLLLVLPGYEARLLAPLAIERMPGLSDAALRELRGHGVRTLHDLAHADAGLLTGVLGRGGSVVALHARGLDDRTVAPSAPKGVVRSAAFGMCAPRQARAAVRDLAEAAAQALRRSGHMARQVRVRVRDAAGERLRTETLRRDTMEPAGLPSHLVERADELAARLLHPSRHLLEAAVSFTALTPMAAQLNLFAEPRRTA